MQRLNHYLRQVKNTKNFVYFHRKRIFVNGAALTGIGTFMYTFKDSKDERMRIALAGCMALTIVESAFHMVDTVNIRSKANPHIGSSSMTSLVTKIWAKEGILGFGRGFSAAFYGGLYAGFFYFYLYKHFKGVYGEYFGDRLDFGWVCLLASFTSEFMCLTIKYPFDLVKCRLQSVNAVFKYKNLLHAF